MIWTSMVYLSIIQSIFLKGDEKMITWRAAKESTGTSSEIKEQYKKYERFIGGVLFIFPFQRKKENGRR